MDTRGDDWLPFTSPQRVSVRQLAAAPSALRRVILLSTATPEKRYVRAGPTARESKGQNPSVGGMPGAGPGSRPQSHGPAIPAGASSSLPTTDSSALAPGLRPARFGAGAIQPHPRPAKLDR